MLVSPVERLVALGLRIPPHTDGQNVRIGRAFQGREIKLQSFYFTLLILKSPASYGRQGSQTEKTFLILQMFIAAENFFPLTVGVFCDDDAGDDGARQVVGGSL